MVLYCLTADPYLNLQKNTDAKHFQFILLVNEKSLIVPRQENVLKGFLEYMGMSAIDVNRTGNI